MTTAVIERKKVGVTVSVRAEALAFRILQGASELAEFVSGLSDREWNVPVSSSSDLRTIGLIVHHVATMYPIEISAAKTIAKGEAITEVTWEAVASMNSAHALEHDGVSKREAIDLLLRNSAAAAEAVRQFSDAELDRAAPFSLSYGAPMTAQFVIEDHALRHAWHHLYRIRKALGK